MSAQLLTALLALMVVALLALAWLVTTRLRARNHRRAITRDKLGSVVGGHHEMADAHEGVVEALVPQAEGHREAAADHLRIADELEERIERERRHLRFHEERAAETARERERI